MNLRRIFRGVLADLSIAICSSFNSPSDKSVTFMSKVKGCLVLGRGRLPLLHIMMMTITLPGDPQDLHQEEDHLRRESDQNTDSVLILIKLILIRILIIILIRIQILISIKFQRWILELLQSNLVFRLEVRIWKLICSLDVWKTTIIIVSMYRKKSNRTNSPQPNKLWL